MTLVLQLSLQPLFTWKRLLTPFLLLVAVTGNAADYSQAEKLYRSGDYHGAEAIAQAEVDAGVWNENWSKLLIRCQLTRGAYPEALQTYEKALPRYASSLALRLLGRDVMRMNGLNDRAREEATYILQTLQRSPTRYLSRENMVAAGRYFADRGEDARQVLDLFYDRVQNVDPTFVDAYVATAELALDKGDYAVASETLAKARKISPDDPQLAYLSARAWETTDRSRAEQDLAAALAINPRHVPSLLFQIEHAIDSERYDVARSTITRVLEINPHTWQAWCYLAVLAHLDGQYEIEMLMRAAALSTWAENPEVDHLIGRKLSDKYRFAEGSEYQRRSLVFDPKFHRASFQLAQDLLRLGFDDVGWEMANRVASEDPYNVVAHNLVTLYDSLQKFSVITQDDIYVRMDPREASIYGSEVIELLSDAKRVLCEKYEVDPEQTIYVEIFPTQKDFAIRTFGLPGGDGFLGVCFGRVVTANSPASQGPRPSNWKSVLWHEFCHVVTLEKTKNRMPRWLSEGISVYEERQRDSSWGEKMTPEYRAMILGDDLTPVSQLSSAFLSPPSGLHLQFAYYESSLVVEFLIERYGLDSLRTILDRLGEGIAINEALEGTVGSIDRLDVEFAEYAKQRAKAFGARADWAVEVPKDATLETLVGMTKIFPSAYAPLRKLADMQLATRNFDDAIVTLNKILDLDVVSGERGGILEQLAMAYREIEDVDNERATLEEVVEITSDALPALERLIEFAREEEEWQRLGELAEMAIAIQPLRPLAHEAVADAGEKLDRPDWVANASLALLELGPLDVAGTHFRTATALAKLNRRDEAKHHLLRALAEAPRYRAAHRLFNEIVRDPEQTEDAEKTTPADPEPIEAGEVE